MNLVAQIAKNVQQDTVMVARKQRNAQSAKKEDTMNKRSRQLVKDVQLARTVQKRV
jgi:hypothetical protein